MTFRLKSRRGTGSPSSARRAGKTTLLKVLAGVYEPTSGSIETSGAVRSLLDVNVGFNLDATGYENIILRGMFMNMRPEVMKGHVEQIADFTELGPYLDMPVRTYSAGMTIRLSFAIATCVAPEILVMDEWLAAGDASFLEKAKRRMEEFGAQLKHPGACIAFDAAAGAMV